MWIAVGIIALAMAMMIGPILLMQPSKRQRRVAKLRTAAAQHGLKVRMTPMPSGTVRAGETVACYYRCWSEGQDLAESWILARHPFAHGLHFFEDWDWVGERSAVPAWQDAIRQALPALPGSVLAVESTPQSMGVYWLEDTAGKAAEQATDEIAQWLKQLMSTKPQRKIVSP